MRPNNILLFLADQWRWDALGVTGGWLDTPNLDRLAHQGMVFENCHTNSPLCVPARTSLATGLYPHNTGVWANLEYDLPINSNTWMKQVRDLGYRTSLIGKSHLHRHVGDLRDREDLMHGYGFDVVDEIAGPRRSMRVKSNMTELWEECGVWDAYIHDYHERFTNQPFVARPSPLPLELYADVYVGQKARQYLRDYTHDLPWCCIVSFGGPHEPWDAPEPYASMYDPAEMPTPTPRPPAAGGRPKGFLDRLYEAGNVHSPSLTTEQVAAMRANYAGNITLIDEQIGDILNVLEERGTFESTEIIFVSDHGEMNGDHGLIYKENFLGPSAKVPLIVSTAEMRRAGNVGRRYRGMIEWFDVGPTIFELAGATGPLPYRQFARSLVPVLEDSDREHRSDALCELHGEVSLQTMEWKLALNGEGEAYLLFDLREDPSETQNLIGMPGTGPVVADLKDRILHRLLESQNRITAHEIGDTPQLTT